MSADTPLITIVTPVFNGERYLSQTIDAVLAQTMPDFEYYIVDGGSSDSTPQIISEYAAKDARIKVITEPDHGLYDAVFKGLFAGTGTICGWINADDMLMPWCFTTIVDEMQRTSSSWLTGQQSFWDAENRLVYVAEPMLYPRVLIQAGLFHGRGMAWIQQESTYFTRALLNKVPPAMIDHIRHTKLAGDSILWREFAKHTSLHVVPTVISGFRYHPVNLSSQLNAYTAELTEVGFPRIAFLRPLLMVLRFVIVSVAVVRQRLIWERIKARLRPRPEGSIG